MYKSIVMLSLFSFAMPIGSGGMDLDLTELDANVNHHEVSDWDSKSKDTELSSAIVSGLASTKIKTHLVVQPKTAVLNFNFYHYLTQLLKEKKGMTSVRLANIIIHYQPYSDDCQGVVSYALVDTRYSDTMDAEPHALDSSKKNNVAKVVGKVKHLVTVDCSREAFIQFSMNHHVATSDINKIKLCQVVSGIDMRRGKLAKVNIGWFTVPGDSVIYKPFPAQLYYFPRKDLPELQGKRISHSYKMFVKMANEKYSKEVAMLNGLQKIVNQQVVINNNLESDVINKISNIEADIAKVQNDIETIDNVLPNKRKLFEKKKQLDELERIRKDKLKEMTAEEYEIYHENNDDDASYVEINDHNSVDMSKIVI